MGKSDQYVGKKDFDAAKGYLSRYRMLSVQIRLKQKELKKLMELAVSLGNGMGSAVGGGSVIGHSDRVGEGAAKLADASLSVWEDINRLLDQRQEMDKLLLKIKDQRYYELLMRRYVLWEKWEDISSAMGYSDVSYMYKLHGRAVAAFARIMDGA